VLPSVLARVAGVSATSEFEGVCGSVAMSGGALVRCAIYSGLEGWTAAVVCQQSSRPGVRLQHTGGLR
jgi:hypothetical protein